MIDENDPQRTPGRRQPCCISMAWAIQVGYVKRGYLWWKGREQFWIPWCLKLYGEGWVETSPIHFCPFSGHNLDEPEG